MNLRTETLREEAGCPGRDLMSNVDGSLPRAWGPGGLGVRTAGSAWPGQVQADPSPDRQDIVPRSLAQPSLRDPEPVEGGHGPWAQYSDPTTVARAGGDRRPWPANLATLQPQPCGRHLGDFCPVSEHHCNLFHACLNFKFIFSFNFCGGT